MAEVSFKEVLLTVANEIENDPHYQGSAYWEDDADQPKGSEP
jgi:hypothetical protein